MHGHCAKRLLPNHTGPQLIASDFASAKQERTTRAALKLAMVQRQASRCQHPGTCTIGRHMCDGCVPSVANACRSKGHMGADVTGTMSSIECTVSR